MAKKTKAPAKEKDQQFPLPEYIEKDDIYNRAKELPLEEEENTTRNTTPKAANKDEVDLDIPGAELDDEDENIGEEDEENNYYSLGGDNHHDLDEDHEDR